MHATPVSPWASVLLLTGLGTSCSLQTNGSHTASPAVGLGGPDAPVMVPPGGDLLQRSTFEDGRSLPWMPLFIEPASGEAGAQGGAYCLRIDRPGKHRWDVQFRHREMTMVKRHSYHVRFSAWSSVPIGIYAKVGMSGAPYTEYWGHALALSPTHQKFAYAFEVWTPDDPSAEFAFHLSDPDAKAPATVCFDDLHLTDPAFTPPPKARVSPVPAVRVNQIGYFPRGPKRATWVLEGKDAQKMAGEPVPFELFDSGGTVVHRGMTEPFGRDPSSGAHVQRIDFSSYVANGEGLRLRVLVAGSAQDAVMSDPFAIRPRVLGQLPRDALRYFYFTRSGIALVEPHVENPVWLRPVGHPTDASVKCAPDAGCRHVLDVSGGWYDAGDYGKYVVNGGLATWLLLNLWEISQELGLPLVGAQDRELNLPESGNGQPDLLDEARWEVEWLLKMQVPQGDPQAGLVHHKIHDVEWTALGTPPVLSPSTPRQLRPVSTAATLNLAAVGAQAARVFAQRDPEFAARCLGAAKRAWAAAESHPALVISGADNHGGGAYEDADTSDERFWAATELFLTTGDQAFLATLTKSPHYLHPRAWGADGLPQAMDWRTTDALGTLALALDTKRVPAKVREANRRSIVEVAEAYVALCRAEAFGQPYSGTRYPWGSNSFVLNNGIVLGYAHAFTGERRFLEGAVAAMDYVVGRNALGKSYVSGYGARPLSNPHHRLWAHSLDPKFPPAPPGVVSGGPNSELQDPYSKAGNLGCIGQTCYFDHIEAYSANEVAINWNAELSWLAAYLNAVL